MLSIYINFHSEQRKLYLCEIICLDSESYNLAVSNIYILIRGKCYEGGGDSYLKISTSILSVEVKES